MEDGKYMDPRGWVMRAIRKALRLCAKEVADPANPAEQIPCRLSAEHSGPCDPSDPLIRILKGKQ